MGAPGARARLWRASLSLLAATVPLTAVNPHEALAAGGCSAWESEGPGSHALGLASATDEIKGDDQDNVIRGTPGDDYIFAYGGNDVVYGNGGDDVVCGGDGNDTLFGDDGSDAVYGEAGDDILRGGAGDDNLFGGPGADGMCGGAGRDTAYVNQDGDHHDCEVERQDVSGRAREQGPPDGSQRLHLLGTCRD